MAEKTSLVRPICCWYCSGQMYARGHQGNEREVRVTVDTRDWEEVFFLHERCWNKWQTRRHGSEDYEIGYRDGMQQGKEEGIYAERERCAAICDQQAEQKLQLGAADAAVTQAMTCAILIRREPQQ